jgi:hypothetical protein
LGRLYIVVKNLEGRTDEIDAAPIIDATPHTLGLKAQRYKHEARRHAPRAVI